MQRSTLVVDDDDSRRRHLVHALSRRGLRYLDVADAFGAMAALGRADFGAVVATEGRRTLSLRGLCQLARRRHPDVVILVIHRDGSDPAAIPTILGTSVNVIAPESSADDVAAAVEDALLRPHLVDAEDLSSNFSIPVETTEKTVPNRQIEVPLTPTPLGSQPGVLPLDEDPTIKTAVATLNTPVQPQPALAPNSLAPDEPTERIERTVAAAPSPVTLGPSTPAPISSPPPVSSQPAPVSSQPAPVSSPPAPISSPPPPAPIAPISSPSQPSSSPPLSASSPSLSSSTAQAFAAPAELTMVPTAEAGQAPPAEPTQPMPAQPTQPLAAQPTQPLAAQPTQPMAVQPTSMTAQPTQPTLALPLVLQEPAPLLEGLLDGATGPALLLGVFSQELTGRLVVKDGPAAGTLYFYRGEPVWADDPLGDAGVHRRLVQKGKLPPDARIDAVAQGQLLGALVQRGLLTGQQMHDFMRELVRDYVLLLSIAATGAYRFEEDRKFLDVAPLLRVNPFGLVLESRRKSVSPAQLIAVSAEIDDKYVVPGPGLGKSADKLAPFVRGARLDHVIDGTKTVRQVLEYTSLDQFMGTLVILSLRDTKLVSLEAAPYVKEGGVTLNDNALLMEVDDDAVTLVDAEFPTEPPQSEDEAKARENIFGLYMRLKPLTVPRQVLGVGFDADIAEIEAAYHARMRELDPALIPEGSAQQLLIARVDELRKKVTSAYQALNLQLASSPGIGTDVDITTKKTKPGSSNPF